MQKYSLVTDDGGKWYTGLTKDGKQVLMSIDFDAEICILFDQNGNMESVIERYFNAEGQLVDSSQGPNLVLSNTGWSLVKSRFADWLKRMIVVNKSINVSKFWLEDRLIGIESMPARYQAFLENSSKYDDEESEEAMRFIDEWNNDGLYVFWWNEEYWCNPDGTIDSS